MVAFKQPWGCPTQTWWTTQHSAPIDDASEGSLQCSNMTNHKQARKSSTKVTFSHKWSYTTPIHPTTIPEYLFKPQKHKGLWKSRPATFSLKRKTSLVNSPYLTKTEAPFTINSPSSPPSGRSAVPSIIAVPAVLSAAGSANPFEAQQAELGLAAWWALGDGGFGFGVGSRCFSWVLRKEWALWLVGFI